ncbi:MAG: glutamate--tRNA ligase [Alphaproteobacteria bacterium]|nr:glutamate--tRNA ligase [Alphaproteobacteria bacterium]
MATRVRFAPSPTGRLHVGNIRSALFNVLFARKTGGKFLLRIDDTDRERSTAAFEAAIKDDLRWLGFDWDETAKQSDRFARYDAAAEKLKAAGRLYACYETPEELERKRKRALASGRPPIYDRTGYNLSAEDRAALEGQGRRPHWRFLLEGRRIQWDDAVRGAVEIDTKTLSDPVLIRADGSYLYTLPSVVDDIELAVSDVIRGEDHVTNTAAQVELIAALGAQPPRFAHLPLLTGVGGEALSKRLGSLGVDQLRAEGIVPLAIAALLARLGTSEPVGPVADFAELVESFDFAKIGRAPAHFDPAELRAVNAKTLHAMPYEKARPHLAAFGAEAGEAVWLAIRDNCETLADAAAWTAILTRPLDPAETGRALTEKAATLLPPGPWSEETWGAWTKAVSAATGKKGKDLFQPLRLALTGRPHGPEMKKLLPLLGLERAKARLEGRAA